MLNNAGLEYETMDASEHMDQVVQYDIQGAPTLLVLGDNKFDKYSGVSAITKYFESR
jgi:hypothetical protein